MSTWSDFSLQTSNSPIMEEFTFFHDYAMMVLVFIITFVGFIMASVMWNKFLNLSLLEGQTIECIWTLIPAFILTQVAIPSLLLLYMLDESMASELTVKAVGHQWYWSYEFTDLGGSTNIEYDSYMVPDAVLNEGGFRLLDVDNRLVLPDTFYIRVLVSSTDVLHSWTVPALGIKADACPGRLNQVNFMGHRDGVFYGQCSEICGVNHSFMPIVVEVIDPSEFLLWISAK